MSNDKLKPDDREMQLMVSYHLRKLFSEVPQLTDLLETQGLLPNQLVADFCPLFPEENQQLDFEESTDEQSKVQSAQIIPFPRPKFEPQES